MKLKSILPALAMAAALSCSSGGESPTRPFPMPKVPSMVVNEGRADYMVRHYWDGITDTLHIYSSRDSSIINGVAVADLEKAIADLAGFVGGMPLETSGKMWDRAVPRLAAYCAADTASNALVKIPELLEKYFYDPNSPVRDEDVFGLFAARMAECPSLSEARRAYYREVARKTSLNRRESKATNFTFTDRYGRRYSLYGITSDLTILFFSNPGCTACKEIITALDGSPQINELVSTGRISVLNIYIDEELDEWYKYMPIYPDSWYNGYDDSHTIRDEELYDVRAIPSLYLLDSNKTVLMKDVPLERLMQFLSNLSK